MIGSDWSLKLYPILKISLYQSFHILIATKIFNYKNVFKNLSIDDYKSKPPECTRESSPFQYNLAGHVITAALNIVENIFYEMCLPKGQSSVSFHKHKVQFQDPYGMDSVEDYATQWAK